MKTQVLADTESLNAAVAQLADWADTIRFAYAWMSTDCPAWSQVPDEKITESVVGAHFAQTDPAVFEHVLAEGLVDDVAVLINGKGTFHPKVIVGIRGKRARAIVGSSNFTRGGFDQNTELNLLLSGKLESALFGDLLSFIDDQWFEADWLDEAWVRDYRERHARRPKRAPNPPRPSSPDRDRAADFLSVEWSSYFELVTSQFTRDDDELPTLNLFDGRQSYMAEVVACAEAFAQAPSFADLTPDQRSLIAGVKGSNGSFGGTRHGRCTSMLRDEPEAIAALLDEIPSTGEVDLRTARDYLAGAMAMRHVGITTATRLLAMKRPDRFLVINKANRPRLERLFGQRVTDADAYAALIERIWAFPWANAERPVGPAEEDVVWRARVAFLDVAVYDHPSWIL